MNFKTLRGIGMLIPVLTWGTMTYAQDNDCGFTANAGPDQFINDTRTYLEGNAVEGTTGTWSLVAFKGGAVFDVVDDPHTLAYRLQEGENHLRWTLYDGNCTSTDVVIITVAPCASAEKAQVGDDQYITTNSTRLEANEPINALGQWSIITGSATIEGYTQHNARVSDLREGDNIFRWTLYNGGCFTYADILINVSTATDIDSEDKESIRVYPNPAKDILHVEVPDSKASIVTLLAMDGSVAKQQLVEDSVTQLELQDMSPGIYVLRVLSPDKLLHTEKVIVR